MSFYKQKKQGLMGYLVRREYGVCGQRERCFNGFAHHFVEGAAALPTRNTPCNLPGQSRSTFLTVFSPDHTKVASTHGDHNIRVTEIKTGHCIHTLKGHPRTPWCIAFHPTIDGILASGCLGGEVHIWDLKGGGSEVWKSASSTIKGFVISSLTFHPTDQLLVIATNNTLLFWDWNRSEPFITMSTLSDVEKVRWVKFDSLGMNLYTGIANLPNSPDVPGIGEINEEMEEDTLLADRYRSVIDEISARSRRHDPIISLRPLSPTHADGLAGSLRYAESITQRARLANQQPQQQQQPQAPAQRMQMHAPVLPPPPPPPPLMTSRLPPHRLSATDFNYALPLDQLTTLNRSFHETEYRTPQVRLVPYGFSSVDSEDSNNDTHAPQSRNHPSSAQTVAAADVNAQSYRQGLLHTFHRARLQRSRRRLEINASLFNRTMHANRRPETETLAESQLNTTHNLHSRLEDMLREARNTYSGNPELSRANSEDDDMIMIHHHRQDSRSSSGDIFSSTVHSSNEASQSSDRIVTAQSFSDSSRETSRRENPASGLLNFFHQSRFSTSQPSTASTLSSQPRTLSSLAASSAVTSTNSVLNAELYGSAVSPPWQTVEERSVTRVRNLNATSGVVNRIQLPSQSTPMHAHRSSTDQHTERVHSPSIGTSNDQFHGHEAQIELVRNESHAPPIADTSTRRQLQFMRMLDQPEANNEILPASYQLAIHNASTAFIEDGRWTGSTGDININRHDSLLITTAATATTNTTSTTTSALATNGSSSSGSSSGINSSNSNSSNSSSSASGRGSSSSRRDYVPALRNRCVTSCITSTSSTSSISQRNIHRTSTSMASDQSTTNLGYGDHNYGVESRSEGNRDQRGASTQSVADMRTVEQPQRLASILESEVRQALERVQERQQDIRDTLDALDRWRQTDNTSNRGFSTVSLNQMNERVERLLLRNRNRGASGAVRHQSSSPLYSGIQNNEQDEPTLGRASAAHESTTQISQQPAREQLNNNVSVTSSVPTSNPTTSLPQPMPSSSSQSEFLSDRLEHLNQINRQAAEVTQRLNRRMNSLAVMRANRATSVAGRWGGGGIGHHGRREYARYGSRHNQHEEIPEITITSPQGPMHRSMLDMTDPQGPTLQPTSGEMELNTDVMTAQSNSNRQTQPAHTTDAALEASLTQQQEHAAYPVPPSYGTVTQPISSAIPVSRPTIPERPNIEPLVIQIPEMDAGNESSTSSFTVNADQPTGLVEQGSRNDESADIFSRDALQERTRRRRRRYVMRQREMLDRLDRSHASRANTNRRQSSAGNRLFGSHYIHPDYESSLLDNNANLQASQDTLQAVINRVLSSGYNAQPAVGSNIINFTHRIQCWDMSKLDLPKIHNRTANIVVPKCCIHNDASCDISSDGQLLAVFVPSHRGFPDATILGVFSLQPSTRGQCLYTKAFGPNAITVSISPLNNFVLVGLAARRLVYTLSSRQMVAQVFKMVKVDAGEDSMEHVSDMMHPCSTNVRTSYLSVNCASWLPSVGSGVVYGTNKGDLHICHPWHAETTSNLPLGIDVNLRRGPRYRGRRNAAAAGPMVQSTAATQTVQQRVRVTASTQTDGEELRNAA